MALSGPSQSSRANTPARDGEPQLSPGAGGRASAYAWMAGGIWTILFVGAMLVLSKGGIALLELNEFIVLIGLWCGGVLMLAGTNLAARPGHAERNRVMVALEASERLAVTYQTLLSTSLDGIVETDEHGRILIANQAFLEDLGYTLEEVVQLSVADLEAVDSPEQVRVRLQKIRETGRVRFETQLRGKDGHLVDFEMHAMHVPGRARFVTILRDITGLKRASEALRESEGALKAAQRVAEVGSWKWHVETDRVEWSDEMYRIFGLVRDGFSGRLQDVIAAAIHPDDRVAVEAANRAVIEHGRPAPLEYRVVRPDGSVRRIWAEAGELLRDGEGRPVSLSGIVRDITEQRQMEEALEKRLVALTSPVNAGSIEFDDLFNRADIQKLQDQFARAAGVASIITRPDGTPITQPSNFTHLCAGIIRQTEKGRVQCFKSDAALGVCKTDGPTVQRCLSGGLWDAGASIVVGGRHVANWLIGQVRNEAQDEAQMRAYARHIGADEAAFMEAFRDVPSMSRERFEEIAQTLFTLAQQLSSMAYQNVQQARFISERKRAEQALRASEEHFRATIEHAGAGYFRINRARCFETVNPAWLEMHGFTAVNQIVGQPCSATQVDADRAKAEQIVEEGFSGREFRTGEFTRKRADGTLGFHTFSLHPVRKDDEVIALEGFLIDTTSLHQAMADYRMLFDTMLDGFALHEIICDAAGRPVDYRFLAVNPAFERQTGLKAADLIGRTVLEILPQTERTWIETYGRVALTGEAMTFENHSAALNRHFEVSAFCPSPRRFACVVVDITARRLAEHELRKLSRAVEQSPVSVVITNTAGAIEYINPYFTATTGYTLDEVRGRNPRVISSGETAANVYQDLWRTITAGSEWRGEFHNKRKDGGLFWEAATIAPILDDHGRITHFLAVKEEITDRKRAEAALASSERRFRSLVESVPNIAVQGYDRQRRVIFWNAASEALYGYTAAEALGQKLEDLIIPAQMREAVIVAVEGFVSRNEQIPAGELVLQRKDGSAVSVYSSHVKLERADGEPEMHCIDIDLTARKEAERALVESHDFHLRMLSHAPALIWRSGTDGRYDWFNATWLAFTGRTLEQEIGDGWVEGVHSEDLDRCLKIYLEAFAERRPFEMEYRLRRSDGEFRWISDNGIPFTSLAGEFGGFVGYCYDLTERRRADAQIREQAALLDVTEDAVLVVDLHRTVTYWNRGAERMYEIPAADARGRKLEELVYREIPPDYHTGWLHLSEVNEWASDRRQVTRSGREIDVRTRATLVRNAMGQPTSVLVVTTDVTESKRMEAQFLRAQRLESLGALASGVAHDLNNVLTPILMSVELLRPIAHEQYDQDLLQLLSDSARRGSDIVQQLLLFGRGSDTPRSPLNAGGIIKDVGLMMRQTFPKNIVLSVQAPANLWLVEVDRTQIHQVVLNLCVNARDAMPRGGRLTVGAENVHVDASQATAHGGERAGPYVRVQIADTGTGISRENLEKIFDPFFTTKPVGQGTGLGLATVLGIVRSHRGFVVVTSKEGQGSTFAVYLPAAQSTQEASMDEDSGAMLRGNDELVLVAEDEENIRSLLQRALTSHNYRVLMASDGAEAIGVYARHAAEVRLLLTDMMMPVMDGTQTVRALRQINPRLPVVAISGLPAQRVELEKNPGPQIRFLPKPFATHYALRLVREALDEVAPPPVL